MQATRYKLQTPDGRYHSPGFELSEKSHVQQATSGKLQAYGFTYSSKVRSLKKQTQTVTFEDEKNNVRFDQDI